MARPLRGRPTTLLSVLSTVLLSYILFVYAPSPARAQAQPRSPQPPQPAAQPSAPKPDTKAPNDEIVSHDSPATFKVRVNVVLVRVVVRDSNGKVVTNLKKEDFQLTDERKPQVISSFSVETPASHAPAVDSSEAAAEGPSVKAPELPQRFVALLFDDLHLSVHAAT